MTKKENYIEMRRIWKETCEEKKKVKREEDEAELREIKNENQVWKYLNKWRKKRETAENNISDREWKKYFRNLLEGTEEKQ